MKRSKIGKTEESPKFAQNRLFVTFSIFVPEKLQKHLYKKSAPWGHTIISAVRSISGITTLVFNHILFVKF